MGRRIKRAQHEAQPRPQRATRTAPAAPVPAFEDELAAVLETLGLRADDLERGGVLNPFAGEDGDGFRPFAPCEFVWPHAALRRVEHRAAIERHLRPHRRFFSYIPRGITA
ncbi:Uncharacterised protein (plasmid) [Tsukamurella tyrosinosolvens]|uniref:Uncharacterized protein n=1 Tax=Tsukamurella tyrosinosolvens TaxID=57704 RepID=A0A1H5AZU4_TSUTY|nr:hypothetical protein [Tsukamurella tyrosinosolvens]KXO95203.1 hypothetical protein AXK58_10735 [Tsukamurella tyrosinosolvens]SED47989.1 hypothetical protein SAMN04489793_5055 [Tsukamurella tyrosinosolvens]VEH88869.1 Uncharacterised protein [Tsukamurella tyrosinosolvens]